MMSLSANFTCELEGVDYSLFSQFNFSKSNSAFEPHLQVVAEDFHNLLICHLETQVLISFPVEFSFALDDKDNIVFSEEDRMSKELLTIQHKITL